MKKSFLFNILFIGFVLFSCHKSESDDNPPALTITSPTAGSSFGVWQTISITVLISVTRKSDGSILFTPTNPPEVHDLTSYNIDEKWNPVGISSTTPVTLTISAEDHDDHLTIKTVDFTINP
ncbi:MAG: hypothetical protein IPO25_01755 [Saprospiraceae bacterium]|nr:hypothetical protein [Saprospiraceae bacterium]